MSPWENWLDCPKSCGTGIQTRIRQCVFKDDNYTAKALPHDEGCADGYNYGYYDEKKCNTQDCRMLYYSRLDI